MLMGRLDPPSMHVIVALAAPALLPTSSVLRPRFGALPIVLIVLCLLWLLLLRAALPRFGRRATLLTGSAAALLVLSWVPRIAARTWGTAWLTPAFYKWVVLPSTVIQVTILLTLMAAPLWAPLGLWAKRRQRGVGLGPRASTEAGAIGPRTPEAAEPAAAPASAGAAMDDPSEAARSTAATAQARTEAPAPSSPEAAGPRRRDVIGALAWSMPAGALLLSGYGVAVGAQRIAVRRVRLAVPGLPPSLRGLRIGQVTDIHIASDLTQLSQLEAGLDLLSREGLDLMVATGDLCDTPRMFLDVVSRIAQVPARLGRFSCLGNHELYVGLPHVRRAHERAGLELLEDRCVRIGDLTVAGTSYPHSGTPRLSHARVPPLLDAALRDRHADTATLLLSHHPHVFRHVAGRKVDLMLAGHTHGAQVGLGDRSLLEGAYGYVRGAFQGPAPGDPAQLFVSSGLGHWLPFRVNCPPEVVVIELV